MAMWLCVVKVALFGVVVASGGLAYGQVGEWTLPRTGDGHPDLQGVWDFRTLTPLQRPSDRGDQAVLTQEEAAEIEASAAQRALDADQPTEVRTEPLPVGAPVGGYNNFWFDRGAGVVDDNRTSLIVAPADGKYIIEVRESAYANGNNYRLHVGTFPRPTAAYPAGGKKGEEVEVKFLGLPSGELMQKFALPAEEVTDFGVFAKDDGGIAPTPNNFRLFEHGNAFEVEPNNEMAKASPVELPLAFNGIIQEPKDVDFFRFSAKNG